MMRIIVLFIIVWSFQSCVKESYTQEEIDNALDFMIGEKVDDFTNETSLRTKEVNLVRDGSGEDYFRVSAYGFYNDNYCTMSIEFHGLDEKITIFKGKELWIKTSDDEVIKLKFIFNSYTDKNKYSNVLYHTNMVRLDENSMKKLRDSEITKIRWYTSEGYIERDVPERFKNSLNKVMHTLLVAKSIHS